jgi:hypothetical protein
MLQVSRIATTALVVPTLLLLIGCGQPATPPPADQSDVTIIAAPGVAGGVISVRTQINARVTAKDEQKRTVTLLGNDAKEQTIAVPEGAVNFPQVKVGDLLAITLTEEIAAVVVPAGVPIEQGEAAVVGMADQGKKPAGVVGSVTQIRGKVVAIDAKARTATIVTDSGARRVLPVRDDVNLSRHQVGDQVVMRVSELVELAVQAPAPAPAAKP